METIRIKDLGPIHLQEIPLPEGGGVVVLRGHQGAGKTTAIEATQALVEGRAPEVTVNDEAADAGSVEGFGARLRVGRKATRTGDALEVRSIEGRDPSTLVDPGYKDAAANDVHRIRSLCRLARASAAPDAFRALLGDEERFSAIVPASTFGEDDLPATAAAVKRALERAAQGEERERDGLLLRAQALREQLDPEIQKRVVDGDAPQVSSKELMGRLERQAGELATLKAARAQGERDLATITSTRAALAGMEGRGDVGELEQASARFEGASTDVELARKQLRLAQDRASEAERDAATAAEDWNRAKADGRTRRKLEQTLEQLAAVPAPPPDDQIDVAQRALEATGKAAAMVAVIEDAARRLSEADQLVARAQAKAEDAGRLREAAAGTDAVLTTALSKVLPPRLRVRGGVLLFDHPDQGEVAFSRLSEGERWRVALEVSCRAIGGPGLLAVKQEAWQSLQPSNRKQVAAMARELGLWLLTAEVDDGELRAEVVEP